MTKVDLGSITKRISFDDGSSVVLLDRLAKGGLFSKRSQARNIIYLDRDDHIKWRVRSRFDGSGDPFTQVHFSEGRLTAYRWDGGSYEIDLRTGAAKPLVLER